MTKRALPFSLPMVLVLGLAVPGSRAETGQTVTIPRAGYEELLRKEQELERLRSTHAQTPPGQPGSFGPTGPPAPNSGAGLSGTAVLASGPALDSLPPLPDQGPIRASLLAAYFLREPATAATRLRDQTLRVTGRVVGFEKPLLTRNYHVLLETDQPTVRVRCVVYPPENLRGVYLAQAGTVLMLADESGHRRPLLRIGDTALLEGRVKGLEGQVVEMTGCRLLPSP